MVGHHTSSLTLADHHCSVTGVKPWKQLCDQLVIRLDEYSDALLRNMRDFLEIEDTHGAEIIQNSCVGCLTHLAMLCDLIGRVEPSSKSRTAAICDSSLERLGRLTQQINRNEYTYLDLLLGVRHPVDHSWRRSAR